MTIRFFKYQGTGNDFVIIDNRNKDVLLTKEQISLLCNRRFGVGSDGLMLLENHSEYDFKMKYFNSNGNEGTMCGNGGRCLSAFAHFLGIFKKETIFTAIDGTHKAIVNKDETISLQMHDVEGVKLVNKNYFLNTGSPHYVTFRENIKNIDVFHRGEEIRNSKEFSPDGVNVNFVEISNHELFVRTYERGVEDETFSCGTGVTASAICASIYSQSDKSSYPIVTKGGKLNVSFKKENDNRYTNVWLTGPANMVFKGEIELF